MTSILDGLNPRQQEAVTSTDGPLMILAGAGSGKTRTIVKKIQYLLEEKQVSSHQILALTFSNKAAREMRERLEQLVPFDIGALTMTTFHSFSARILRMEAQCLGLSRHFTIYDDSDSKSLAKQILGKHGISEKDLPPNEILSFIDDLKNNGFYPGCPRRGEYDDYSAMTDDDRYRYYLDYESELHRSNAIDFGGLLTGILQLFESHPDVLQKYQRRYRYILVDEYQDTNRAQFHLVHYLASLHRNICVVGDEDQSIYSWRGADIRNILDYESVFHDSKVIKLEQNYRSTKTIIEAASALIANNRERKGKTMWTDNAEGDAIQIIECASDRSEADYVGKEVAALLGQGVSPLDIAIFYRNNSQSRMMEDVLSRRRIRYRIIGGIRFYERKEVKDLLAYMRLVVNPKDSLAAVRIINTPPRGIGATSLRKFEDEAVQRQCSLWDIFEKVVHSADDVAHLKLSGKVKTSLSTFVELIEEVRLLEERSASETILPSFMYEKLLHESGYLESLRAEKNAESKERMEHLDELMSALKQYETGLERPNLNGFLEAVTLDTTVTNDDDSLAKAGDISLMTVHGAKGLEYPYVFVVGVEETLFPSFRSMEEAHGRPEEERRLFYVAMTRAMKHLTLTFAQGRMLWGQLKFNGPSMFIHEIPDRYYAWTKYRSPLDQRGGGERIDRDDEYDDGTPTRFIKKVELPSTYPVGTRVVHSVYGKGLVTQVEGRGTDEKVMIRFADGAQKKFMVKFAPLTRA